MDARALLTILCLFTPALLSLCPVIAQDALTAKDTDLELRLDRVIADAIEKKQVPGAVLLVTQGEHVLYRKSHGYRTANRPEDPLAVTASFDLASLTKCVATATAATALLADGRLTLGTQLGSVLQDAADGPLADITVEQLLRHRSGLPAANGMADYRDGAEAARQRVLKSKLKFAPGTDYLYSDVGFIVLGWVIEAVTGKPLDEAARSLVFEPMGLKHTSYRRISNPSLPEESLRFVPTEPAAKGEENLCGVVHDPRARALDGVAGHAGLFANADDLSRYCRILLRGGRLPEGGSCMPQRWVSAMHQTSGLAAVVDRGLGFDRRELGEGSTGPRGKHFDRASFGHTGFTGTSLWMDPNTEVAIVLLTSRLQCVDGSAGPLRERVATTVAEWLPQRPWPLRGELPSATVMTGADRVAAGVWPSELRGARVGLITNHTGRDRAGVSTIDRLFEHKHLKLRRIFAPEHGIRGTEDRHIDDEVDAKTSLPVLSLYGKTRVPTPEALADLDVLVFDIQDIGTRFYTYISTMVNCMEAAAHAGVAFVVLDRPNPIGGLTVAGPLTDDDQLDFVGRLVMPIRHGMTVGEIARMAHAELGLTSALHVIWMTGWRRTQWFDQTGLTWVAPSPNMRNLNAAALYPGIGLLEMTNVSVGRGTATPFEIFGAPWLDGEALANGLEAQQITGVRITPTQFVPVDSKHKGELCSGIFMEVTDRRSLDSLRLGIAIAQWMIAHEADDWDTRNLNRLLKHKRTRDALLAGEHPTAVLDAWRHGTRDFRARRAPFLIYAP
jgi:uncharacterized protein YbbC (DUF1343 family)/CubicO group peptidase (beta-lactamase class C family)